MMGKFKNYITDRNSIVHKNGYIFPVEEYSKSTLLIICTEIKEFLSYLFNNGKIQ